MAIEVEYFTDFLTKIYGMVNRTKAQLALDSTEGAFEVLNEMTDYLISAKVSPENQVVDMKNLTVGTVIAYAPYDHKGATRQTKFRVTSIEVNVERSLPYVAMRGLHQYFENGIKIHQAEGTRYASSNFIADLHAGEITLERPIVEEYDDWTEIQFQQEKIDAGK